MAEVACGLLCSCLPILPKLYQHLAAITPYDGTGASAQALANSSAKPSFSAATGSRNGKGAFNTRRQLKHDWAHLEDQNPPPVPMKLFIGQQETREDQALDKAVEGKVSPIGETKGWP